MTDHKSTEGLREVVECLRTVKLRGSWLNSVLSKIIKPYWRAYFRTMAFELLADSSKSTEQVRAELIAAIEAKLSAK